MVPWCSQGTLKISISNCSMWFIMQLYPILRCSCVCGFIVSDYGVNDPRFTCFTIQWSWSAQIPIECQLFKYIFVIWDLNYWTEIFWHNSWIEILMAYWQVWLSLFMLLLTVPGKLKLLLCLIYSWPDILQTLWIERIIDFNAKASKRTVNMKNYYRLHTDRREDCISISTWRSKEQSTSTQ